MLSMFYYMIFCVGKVVVGSFVFFYENLLKTFTKGVFGVSSDEELSTHNILFCVR